MSDISHTQLLPFQSSWKEKFETEKDRIQKVFGDAAISIEHIGSTSVDGLSSKPIIDIAVLIEKREDAVKFIEPLDLLGYWYDKENSSGERHFFRKGKPAEFHLSIAYTDKGDFWERQILFRDYLRNNPEARNEYAKLKEDLLQKDPTGNEGYIEGKSNFIMRALYPKIKFIYSLPYDRLLTEYEDKVFDEQQIKEVKEYIKKLQSNWEEVNIPVCQALKEITQNRWQEKEIKCYVVRYCKYSGISNPLTLKLDPDLDLAIDTLIHELAHRIVTYDFEKYEKIERKLKRKFPKEGPRTILHIYINFIELKVIKKLFNEAFLRKVIKRGLTFKGIKRAWEIVLEKEEGLEKLFF